MKSELRRVALGLMLLGLYGCGLKGPLYFPPADKADKSEQKRTEASTDDHAVLDPVPGADRVPRG